MLAHREEYPSGRWLLREARRRRGGEARGPPAPRRLPRQGAVSVGGTRQHRNLRCAGNPLPAAPVRKLLKIIRPHQPDEAGAGKPPAQRAQCVHRVARAEMALDVSRQDAPAIGDGACTGQSGGERRHAGGRFQRIAGRDEQPDLVQPEPLQRELGDMAVAGMGRVETAAQQPDPQGAAVTEAGQRRACLMG